MLTMVKYMVKFAADVNTSIRNAINSWRISITIIDQI